MDEVSEEGEFKVTPGRIWLVPLGEDGEPMSESWAIDRVDWGEGQGLDGGLDGGLQGGPRGALMETGREISVSWALELTGERSEVISALIMGMSVSEYRDLVRWAEESAWLARVTGLNWGRFE